jgi:hypothetical protein
MLPDTIHQAIKELRQELERVEYAIRQIEAVEEGRALRGRPPKHVSRDQQAEPALVKGRRS